PNLLVVRMRVGLEKLFSGHDHARGAEAALQRMLVPEGFLQWVEPPIRGKALDGEDFPSVRLDCKHRAALDRLAVNKHGARSADGSFAAHVGTGESELVAQIVNQQQPRLDFSRTLLAVYCD